jgi:hypothetical protein
MQKNLGGRIPHFSWNKYMIGIDRFISAYNEFMLNKPKRIAAWKINRLTNLYESFLKIINTLQDNKATENNFYKRCELLGVISPLSAEQLKEYLIDSPGSFILFNCLFNIIFNSLPFGSSAKEILLHRFDFHKDYEFMTRKGLESKLKIKIRGIRIREDSIKSTITSIISHFRILIPWFHYQNLINMNAKVIRISPQLCKKIMVLEATDKITPGFIATVISIIYEYKLKQIPVNGKFCYYLAKPKYADIYFPLLDKLAPIIESRIDMPEFEDLGDVIMEMFGRERGRNVKEHSKRHYTKLNGV